MSEKGNRKLTMLIVDDEPLIRESLRDFYDWESYNISIIGICKNGIEALQKIKETLPDIVITDIKMPGMTGIDLVREAHSLAKNCKFIIISGYQEFEYAKHAMRYGVNHYLLKPLDDRLLLEAVIEVIQSINIELQSIVNTYKTNDLIRFIIQKNYLYDLFIENQISSHPLLHFIDQEILMCSIKIGSEQGFSSFTKSLSLFITHNNLFSLVFLVRANNSAITILEIPQEGILNRFHLLVKEYEKQNIIIDVTCIKTDVEHCCNTRLRNFFGGCDKIEIISENPSYNDSLSIKNLDKEKLEIIEILREHIKHTKKKDAIICLENYLNQFKDAPTMKNTCLSILFEIFSNDEKHKSHFYVIVNNLLTSNQVNIIKKWFLTYFEQTLFPKTEDTSTIDIIKDYVKKNFASKDISLQFIADNVLLMNVNYLSHLFTVKTSVTFSKFLSETRIEVAKDLLKNKELSIQEIAKMIGYENNPRYFGQVFKKITGKTPSEYVESL